MQHKHQDNQTNQTPNHYTETHIQNPQTIKSKSNKVKQHQYKSTRKLQQIKIKTSMKQPTQPKQHNKKPTQLSVNQIHE